MTLNRAFADKLDQRTRRRVAGRRAPDSAMNSESLPCILVVDDERAITRSVTDLLDHDYQVLTASSAEEGLALLASNPVAVILTDQRMPGGTGAELLAQSLDVAPEATRILFTGYSDISAVIDAVNQGQVNRYITKPWEPEELKVVVSQGLERNRLVVDNRRLLTELSRANDELEQRVRERTTQLREQNKALRVAHQRIEELSRRDALTGLTNRRWLDEVLRVEVERARRYETPLSVAMADLDHFKEINDSFGHAVGDQVLTATARVLEDAVRMTDVVGRYGGEEFLILLPNTELPQALMLAERMRAGLHLMPVTFRSAPVTASFGAAQWVSGDSAATLVGRADAALYEAKHTGRDKVVEGQPKEQTDE